MNWTAACLTTLHCACDRCVHVCCVPVAGVGVRPCGSNQGACSWRCLRPRPVPGRGYVVQGRQVRVRAVSLPLVPLPVLSAAARLDCPIVLVVHVTDRLTSRRVCRLAGLWLSLSPSGCSRHCRSCMSLRHPLRRLRAAPTMPRRRTSAPCTNTQSAPTGTSSFT